MWRWVSHDKPNWAEVVGAIFVPIGFIAAAAAASFAGWQAWVASDHEQKTLRSYVVVTKAGSIENFTAGGVAHVSATFENLGQTPVYDARWQSALDVRAYPLEPISTAKSCDVIMRSPEQGTRALFGKDQPFDRDRSENTPFTQPEIDDVKAGRAAIYFVGRVCYSDIFRHAHYTDFCLYWHWIKDALIGEFCANGNEGDRE